MSKIYGIDSQIDNSKIMEISPQLKEMAEFIKEISKEINIDIQLSGMDKFAENASVASDLLQVCQIATIGILNIIRLSVKKTYERIKYYFISSLSFFLSSPGIFKYLFNFNAVMSSIKSRPCVCFLYPHKSTKMDLISLGKK